MFRRKQEPIPDFMTGENNCVIAVYVTGPDILMLDDRTLRGVPFLFYDGTTRRDAIAELKQQGRHYGEVHEYHRLTLNSRQGRMREVIRVGDETVRWNELYTPSYVTFGLHVPYSFGIVHDTDVANGQRVRTTEDYRRMVEEILPRVHHARLPWHKRLFAKRAA